MKVHVLFVARASSSTVVETKTAILYESLDRTKDAYVLEYGAINCMSKATYVRGSNYNLPRNGEMATRVRDYLELSKTQGFDPIISINGWDGLTTNREKFEMPFEKHFLFKDIVFRIYVAQEAQWSEVSGREVLELLQNPETGSPISAGSRTFVDGMTDLHAQIRAGDK